MTATQPRKLPAFVKWAMKAQVFLLRRNLLGKMGDGVMVIITTGRKSGKQYTTPIGFVGDGDTVYAFNPGGKSDWYKNVVANSQAIIEIRGKPRTVRGETLTDPDEILKALQLFQRQRASLLPRFFGVAEDAQGEALLKAREKVQFVRFR